MSRTLRGILNEGQPGKLGDAARELRMGEAMALVPRTVRAAVASHVLVLPEAAKAVRILRAYAIAGSTTGELAPAVANASVTTGLVGINATGDVLFATADAVTEAEVTYLAHEGTVYEDLIPVASNAGAPLGGRSIGLLLSAEATAGSSTGAKTVVARGSAPSAGEAATDDDPAVVNFNAADAVTQARIRYIAQPGQGDAAGPVGTELDSATRGY